MLGRATWGICAVRLLVIAGLSDHHHHLWLGTTLATIGILSLVVISDNPLDAE